MAGENRLRDPYTILGVSRSADMVEIKAAWRAMAKKLHPDQNRGDPNAQSRFTEVGRAYDLLKDPEKRRRYDEMLNRSSYGGGGCATNAGNPGPGASSTASPGRAGKEPTFMERRAERARMEAEARARAEAEARMREEAEARARLKAQAEARAKAEAATTEGVAAADDAETEVTPEQHEQFFEKLFGSRRQATGSRDTAGPSRRSTDRIVEDDSPETAKAEAKPDIADHEPVVQERAAAPQDGEGYAAYAPDPEDLAGDGSTSPARNLLSYLVKRLTRQIPLPEKAPEYRVDALISIEDLLNRLNPIVNAPDGKLLSVPLPEDAMDGTTVRLEGYGYKLPGMRRGDVIATIRIKPHKWYRHDHYDLKTFHDIDIENAVLGCNTTVETPDGPVRIRVPEWSGSNRTIKVEGHGLPRGGGRRGNLIVEIRVMLWDHPDQKVVDLMRSLREGLFL
jgi:DnaJ-class molecular chaperone